MLTKSEFASQFQVGEIIPSGGSKAKIEITEIGEEYFQFRSVTAKQRAESRISYQKLNAVIEGFNSIEPTRIVPTFQQVLTDRGLKPDYTNEAYLYGIAREFRSRKGLESYKDNLLPDEVPESTPALLEGAKKQITINAYERNPRNRAECIAHWGDSCMACEMSFEHIYGSHGKGYIHVHHLTPLSQVKGAYALNPIKDLRPVCPNCHAMLHRSEKVLSIEELKSILNANSGRSSS